MLIQTQLAQRRANLLYLRLSHRFPGRYLHADAQRQPWRADQLGEHLGVEVHPFLWWEGTLPAQPYLKRRRWRDCAVGDSAIGVSLNGADSRGNAEVVGGRAVRRRVPAVPVDLSTRTGPLDGPR